MEINEERSQERFETSYTKLGLKKEIPGLSGKRIASAWVVHQGSDGLLILKFTDGTVKKYRYNDLGFWEVEENGQGY